MAEAIQSAGVALRTALLDARGVIAARYVRFAGTDDDSAGVFAVACCRIGGAFSNKKEQNRSEALHHDGQHSLESEA